MSTALAKLLAGWGEDDITATAYLTNGWHATGVWELGEEDGLLTFEGYGGMLHVFDPSAVIAAHVGNVEDGDPRFRLR